MDDNLLTPKFREWLSSLIDHDVEFLLVGGFAVIAHGYLRYTGDIDFWISTDPANPMHRSCIGSRNG